MFTFHLQVDLGQAVLKSLKVYYEILKKDLTRDGVVSRKMFLESISGADVQSNQLLTSLAKLVGIRKRTLTASSNDRIKIESEQKLVPILTRIQRKSPEGVGFISLDWILKATTFYESDLISDILKGHNNVHKVKFLPPLMNSESYMLYLQEKLNSGAGLVFLRAKRVLKVKQ